MLSSSKHFNSGASDCHIAPILLKPLIQEHNVRVSSSEPDASADATSCCCSFALNRAGSDFHAQPHLPKAQSTFDTAVGDICGRTLSISLIKSVLNDEGRVVDIHPAFIFPNAYTTLTTSCSFMCGKE